MNGKGVCNWARGGVGEEVVTMEKGRRRVKNRSPKIIYKDPDDGRQRFLLELEFVQCLANPTYIHYLAQNRYFEDEAFIGYLKYLQYWQRPEYLKFIMYPHCLFFLELLQNANFRNAMAHPGNKELAHRQQFYFWKNYRNNRLKHILPRPLPEPVAAPPASVPPPIPPTTMPVSSVPLPGSASSPALSPMQYAIPPGSALAKNDPRNSGVDRRKRKYVLFPFSAVNNLNLLCMFISLTFSKAIMERSMTRLVIYKEVIDISPLVERQYQCLNRLHVHTRSIALVAQPSVYVYNGHLAAITIEKRSNLTLRLQQPCFVLDFDHFTEFKTRDILLFIWKLKEFIEIMENMKDKVDEWEDKVDEWKDTWQDKNEDGRNG
ncbi:hypothetical protein TEA_008714 [Camellia sinensis var. sinensis]|uniref:Mediator of RNA polymerase II transcription subunit 31 n=1 Tax=Camellia sinensis var. sinensis TaxID=542762 RepID=A0A4S4E3Q0_CAMSN|nr:hypothetical protein TEA_008714 [Camellia sinensis var. sinensis]